MDYGLVAFGTALGERVAVKDIVEDRTEDVERVLGYGYDYLHLAPHDVGVTDFAAEAAANALAAAGIAPSEVDLVVLALTDLAEYLYWDAAAAVQARLGVRNAEAVLVDQGCVGGVTALDTLAGRFATRPEHRVAVVIGANRTADAYWNRLDTHSLLFSDGAVAAVAVRGADTFRWRASHAESDGRYADFFRMDVGGAAAPFAQGAATPRARDAWDVMEHFGYDAAKVNDFADEIDNRTARSVHRVCKRLGRVEEDLAWLFLLNDNTRVLTAQADLVGVSLSRTNHRLAVEHGHFGAADHLFALSWLHDSGEAQAGDLVCLAANGRGMHWASTILER